MISTFPDQRPARVRLEWGLSGALALVDASSLVVVVDVLSFSTAVTAACEQGVAVHPFPFRDPAGAAALAERLGAELARPRGDGRLSLSPASLRQLRGGALVLPSPNGATIAHGLADTGATVVVGCLRNATAVARAAAGADDVVLVAAGERWPDRSLRPCLEDLLGAGAIAAALDGLSPEASAAARLWTSTAEPGATIRDATSGRELITAGWAEDVEIAVDYDASTIVPRLMDDDGGRSFRATL